MECSEIGEHTKISYIYGLSSSHNSEIIRYIGYSIEPYKRYNFHVKNSSKFKTNVYKWINNEKLKENTIIITALRCVDKKLQKIAETETILLLKACGANLKNMNNGGSGSINVSKETRLKISIAGLGNKYNVGRKPSENNRLAVIAANSKPKSPETKKNMSIARTGLSFPQYKQRKTSEEDVVKIFELFNLYYSTPQITKMLNLNSEAQVYNVLYGKDGGNYKDIKLKYNLKRTRTWNNNPNNKPKTK